MVLVIRSYRGPRGETGGDGSDSLSYQKTQYQRCLNNIHFHCVSFTSVVHLFTKVGVQITDFHMQSRLVNILCKVYFLWKILPACQYEVEMHTH